MLEQKLLNVPNSKGNIIFYFLSQDAMRNLGNEFLVFALVPTGYKI